MERVEKQKQKRKKEKKAAEGNKLRAGVQVQAGALCVNTVRNTAVLPCVLAARLNCFIRGREESEGRSMFSSQENRVVCVPSQEAENRATSRSSLVVVLCEQRTESVHPNKVQILSLQSGSRIITAVAVALRGAIWTLLSSESGSYFSASEMIPRYLSTGVTAQNKTPTELYY